MLYCVQFKEAKILWGPGAGGRVIQTPFSNICALYYLKVECMEIDWLCKHEKGQNQPSFYVSIFLHWIS